MTDEEYFAKKDAELVKLRAEFAQKSAETEAMRRESSSHDAEIARLEGLIASQERDYRRSYCDAEVPAITKGLMDHYNAASPEERRRLNTAICEAMIASGCAEAVGVSPDGKPVTINLAEYRNRPTQPEPQQCPTPKTNTPGFGDRIKRFFGGMQI